MFYQVIESSLKFGRQLDSDHIPLQHFFIVLEHVLKHGVRPKKVMSKEVDLKTILKIGITWTQERVMGSAPED